MSYLDFQDVRAGATRFSGLAAYASAPMTIGDEDKAADRVTGSYISAGAFGLLGKPPIAGREFALEDDRAGTPAVALLGFELWTSRYGADPHLIGRTVNINGVPTIVIGIVPDRFRFPANSNVWLPLASMPGLAGQPRDARGLSVAGRLAPSGSLAEARAELEALGSHLAVTYPETNRDVRLTAVPINDVFNGRITDAVWLAFITAGVIVLLVSCANVANLFLMRSTARTRELAIRTSIGAHQDADRPPAPRRVHYALRARRRPRPSAFRARHAASCQQRSLGSAAALLDRFLARRAGSGRGDRDIGRGRLHVRR